MFLITVQQNKGRSGASMPNPDSMQSPGGGVPHFQSRFISEQRWFLLLISTAITGDHFHPSLPFTHCLRNPLGPKEGILSPQLTWIWSRGISRMYFSASSEGKTCPSFISPTSSQVGLNCLEWFFLFFSLKLASFPPTHSSSLPMAAAVKPLCSQLSI